MPLASVLVVDDEPDIRALLMLALEGAGHAVTTACDGPSALVECRREQPDLVILDVKMPVMCGLEVLAALRSGSGAGVWRRDIPVVLLSACASPDEIARGLRAGATRYVTKPFRVAHLVALVESLMACGPEGD